MAVRDPDMRQTWSPSGWFARLIARPGFQNVASALPFGRGMARRDGAEIFDILQGFVASQVLAALIELNILRTLLDGPQSAEKLGFDHAVPADRMDQLLRGGMALGLLKRRRDGRYALARKGAAILGVPGLENMIRHNREFYADMADPVALLRGKVRRIWRGSGPMCLARRGRSPRTWRTGIPLLWPKARFWWPATPCRCCRSRAMSP
ncbi:methyltransferase family protein [Roseovarius rhodophyticola]|uniref:Methyltransferase dimerization domain-containing protein n=1 Tax=Roseovarius rhodophyticola TaxID=3080827 RepID=A0ABZ2TCJ1_9RHOB